MAIQSYKIICTLGAIVLACAGCKPKENSEEMSARAREDAIGISASIAAGFHTEATRECKIVGIEDLENCAKNTGTLIDEKSARILATASISRTKDYFDRCTKDFSADYCNQLIARAIQFELRKLVTNDATDFRANERSREE